MKRFFYFLLCAVACFIALSIISMAQTQPRAILTWEWASDPALDPDLNHFIIEQSLSATALPTVTFNAGTALTYTDLTVDSTSRYWYRAFAVDNFGLKGLPSNQVSQRFQDVQPAMPTVFTCLSIASTQPGKSAVGCSVAPVTKYRSGLSIQSGVPVQYNWHMSTTDPAPASSLIGTTTVPNFQIQGLKKNSSYYFYADSMVDGVVSFGTVPIRSVK